MKLKIVGMVDVDVDAATYSQTACVQAEEYARSVGVKFLHATLDTPNLDKAEDCVRLRVTMPYGIPSWSYTVWLVG